MPTSTHQAVLLFLYELFRDYLKPRGGVAMVSALRMRVREGKFREPDILLLRDRADPRYEDRYWLGADLVAEVVSLDHPERDLVEKRADYAEAGIPEYWIVDPREETITVLALEGNAYAEHGEFSRGDTARSAPAPRLHRGRGGRVRRPGVGRMIRYPRGRPPWTRPRSRLSADP